MKRKPNLIILLYLTFITGLIAQAIVSAPAVLMWFLGMFFFIFAPMLLGLLQSARNLALAFAVFAALALALTGGLAWQAQQEAAWPVVPGVVTSQRFCTLTVNGDEKYSGICIDYRYTLNGVEYDGDTADTRELGGYSFLWQTFGVPAAFQPGATVAVYYDPAHPTDPLYTRLLPGLRLRHQIGFLTGGVLFVFAVGAALLAAWNDRAVTAQPHVVVH